jgi:murein DD-endopeptidase MepM/ murein hydrolase activator NlpD
MRWFNPATLALLIAASGMLGYALWRDRPPVLPPIEALTSFQDADAPLLLPADGEPRHCLHLFSGWQLGEIPTAVRFDAPLGSAHGALTHNARPFREKNDARGGHHTGDDLDGIGGANTDLGDPVFATADGLVSFAGQSSPASGKVVVLAHRDRDGRVLESVYAHLDRIDVAVGTLVPRGKRLGTVGTADGRHPAHLHFEMHAGDGVDLADGHETVPLNRLDPSNSVAALAGSAPHDLSPAPLATLLVPRDEPWTTLEIQGAEKLGEILEK